MSRPLLAPQRLQHPRAEHRDLLLLGDRRVDERGALQGALQQVRLAPAEPQADFLSFAMMALEFLRFVLKRENFLGSLAGQAEE